MAPVLQEPVSLLLLPALQLPSTPASLKSSYRSTFEALLPKLIQPNTQTTSRLDVAIVLSPSYPVTPSISRTAIFPLIQTLLAQTYSLICSVGALTKVDLDFPGGLDALSGPIVDIQTFTSASRPYQTIYSVEGETAEAHLMSVITALQSRQGVIAPPVQRLPCGPAILHPGSTVSPYADDGPVEVHKSVAVGGTFDHLHIGHKLLLTATVLLAEPSAASSRDKTPRHITIGITGDALLVNKKYGSVVESWSTRQGRAAEFVESILVFHRDGDSIKKTEYINEPGPNGKVVRVTYGDDISINYTEIVDPFGPTITDENITALVISGETRAGGKAVNDRRKEKGWKELEVFEVDVLDAGVGLDESEMDNKQEKQSFESKISSTEIRRRLHEAQTNASE
ncbi:hypothetical protein LTR10_013274 [Elasticomyces elasticus]|uniref:Cytidyltransferase-like domain-containing protein n=1 Tax=Exophiala sideris TaxID=1016849 RepID=A0ABR0J508_9EURO|nr:hypothetical protein LTR10_013274 [Elasticomyces elasticus]KAK5027498.1 hypothetical protein LTS07_007100 [Exophiala sideris]KAK5034798.1 hypothetical protein LTR13_005980 [Exophiala sideris]KAK5056465.1 hypothetical protein LTR69_008006 [Exophiala sideris]KAK5181044.1 hypothetical protein LTR44_006375 [Eurotiomycetes sp. CCFEE 6388]